LCWSHNNRCSSRLSVRTSIISLYVNDICYAAPGTKIKLFADDTNLFLSDKNLYNLYKKASQRVRFLGLFWNKKTTLLELEYGMSTKRMAEKSEVASGRGIIYMINEFHLVRDIG